jgi:hypothetical protein
MVFSKSVLELGIWTVLLSHLFLTVQTASSHLDYSYCLITIYLLIITESIAVTGTMDTHARTYTVPVDIKN